MRDVAYQQCHRLLLVLLTAFTTVPGRSSKADKRQKLGFRPVHFSAVGLPLQDTGSDSSAARAFQINGGNVVGNVLIDTLGGPYLQYR